MLMNRVQPRRPPGTGEATGGIPRSQPSASQPELTAGVAPLQDEADPELDLGGTDFGSLPMMPLPPPPPGSNQPLALPGFQGAAPGGRSMMGGTPPGMDMFGGGDGAMGGGGDEELMRQILAGLPQRR
jgi:hypothetical protein